MRRSVTKESRVFIEIFVENKIDNRLLIRNVLVFMQFAARFPQLEQQLRSDGFSRVRFNACFFAEAVVSDIFWSDLFFLFVEEISNASGFES